MKMDQPRVAVIGAGIIGLTSATAIQEHFPGVAVTVISEKFSPETTGDGAAGLWLPYLAGDTDLHLLRKWAHVTYHKFLKLWRSQEGPKVGTSLLPITCLSNQDSEDDAKVLLQGTFGYKSLDENELDSLSRKHGNIYKSGLEFVTFICEAKKYLPHLLTEFVRKGGKVEQRKVASLQALATQGYNVIVNCAGLRAEQLVYDKDLFPIRGQIVMVEAPWQRECMIYHEDDSDYVIIPNQDCVILGGTRQKNDYSVQVDASDTKKILEGCYKLSPSLKKAKILEEWVGLRPGRTAMRLELGDPIISSNGQVTFVIHSYGHGGSGITVSWGCALDVVALLQDILPRHSHSKL